MATHDPEARKVNAEMRKSFGRTPEVERAIKQTREIRLLTSGGMDYAHTLAQVYNQITGSKHGKQKIS